MSSTMRIMSSMVPSDIDRLPLESVRLQRSWREWILERWRFPTTERAESSNLPSSNQVDALRKWNIHPLVLFPASHRGKHPEEIENANTFDSVHCSVRLACKHGFRCGPGHAEAKPRRRSCARSVTNAAERGTAR